MLKGTEAFKLRLVRDFVVPAKVRSHEEFSETILMLLRFVRGRVASEDETVSFLHAMYYLLGWMVGDAGKGMGSRKRHTVRLRYELSTGRPENLELGNYVMRIIQSLGIWCERMEDRPPRPKYKPNSSYYWDSHYSPIIGWLFAACLGLGWDQRTSYDPVVMDWLLTAPEDMRLWFLRGLADSDGDVDFRDRAVSITSEPNTSLVSGLFDSLGVHNLVERETARDVSRVYISVPDAFRIRIFNPEVLTHRRKLLEKLASAKTFPRRWPAWLEAKVGSLNRDGLPPRQIVERVLEEDGVFVKMHTVARKADALVLDSGEPAPRFDLGTPASKWRRPYQGGASAGRSL